MKEQSRISLFGETVAARFGARMASVAVALLAVLIALGALLSLLPYHLAHPSMKKDNVFALSTASKSFLSGLETDVALYFVCEGGEREADPDLCAFLNRYAAANEHITVKVVDPTADQAFFGAYGGEAPTNMSVIVASGARYRIVDYTDLHFYYFSDTSYGSMKLTPDEYNDALAQLMKSDSTGASAVQFANRVTPYFDGETQIANAIQFVAREKIAKAYVLNGSNYGEVDASFLASIKQNYDVQTVSSIAALPKGCDLLVMNAPKQDLSTDEARALSTYLANGGKLFLATAAQYGVLQNLNGVLVEYGLSYEASTDKICEGDEDYVLQDSETSYPEIFYAHIDAKHAFSEGFDETFVAVNAHAILVSEIEGVTLTKWLYTSDKAYLSTESKEDSSDGDEQGPSKTSETPVTDCYTFGAVAEKGATQIVWIAAAYSLNSAVDAYAEGGNFELSGNAMDQMTDSEAPTPISLNASKLPSDMLAVSDSQLTVWAIALIAVIPAAVLVMGGVISYVRRRR